MEPRDAYRRPEVFAFMDARMLGAFVSTSRSAKTAARECDAWAAIGVDHEKWSDLSRMSTSPALLSGT